jgi:hypothetical protein
MSHARETGGRFLVFKKQVFCGPVCERIYMLHLIPAKRRGWAEHVAHTVRKYPYAINSFVTKPTNLY